MSCKARGCDVLYHFPGLLFALVITASKLVIIYPGSDCLTIVIIRTLIVYFALLAFMRLMGKRQLSELELPELAVAVLIADLGAHPLQDIGIPLMNGLLPMLILFCCEILISGTAMKSPKLRAILFGKPSFLIKDGKIVQSEMRRARFTPDELAEELRSKDITDIAQVQYAILETDGELNAILYPQYRSATAQDLGLSPEDSGYPVIVINDGRVLTDNLRHLGRNEAWLRRELKRLGQSSASDVYLLIADKGGTTFCAPMEGKK